MDFQPRYRIQAQMSVIPTAASVERALPVPVFISEKRLQRKRQFAQCAFEGFYKEESDTKGKFIWSQSKASVFCQFSASAKLQYAWIEIASTAPDGTQVSIDLNGQRLVIDQRIKGCSTVVAKLPEAKVFHQITLDIHSSTFEPQALGSDDSRELGIALRAIVFGKRATKYRPGSILKAPLHQKIIHALPWNRRKHRRAAA